MLVVFNEALQLVVDVGPTHHFPADHHQRWPTRSAALSADRVAVVADVVEPAGDVYKRLR